MTGRCVSRRIPARHILAILFVIPFFGLPVRAQQNYQTAQDTNQRLLQLAEAARVQQTDYRIGGGDLLRVDVFEVPDLSRDVQVSYTGFIALPLLPVRIQAVGLTAVQLEQKVTELLQVNGLVSHPQVTVSVKERHSHPITVIGAVRRPMVYQAARQTSLLEVLSEAGGIADDAGSVILVTRPAPDSPPAADSAAVASLDGGSGAAVANASVGAPAKPADSRVFSIKLNDLVETGDARFNIPLYGGETVSVPRAGIVYVVGAVNRSGGFVLQSAGEEMTVLKLLALAQGVGRSARTDKAAIIRRNPETGEKKEITLNLKKIMERKSEDIALKTNDILFVPDSASKRALQKTADLAVSLTAGVLVVRAGR